MANNKQFVFTNEVLYERNISDRIWPMFLEAQIEKDLQRAITALKSYYLFTQHWYQKESKVLGERIEKLIIPTRPATLKQAANAKEIKEKAWQECNDIWKTICNDLESYGLFKRSFTPDNNQLALPSR